MVRAFAFALERVVRIVPCSLYACLIGLSSGSFCPLMLRSAASAVLALYAESYLTALRSVEAVERVRRPPFAARVATPALCCYGVCTFATLLALACDDVADSSCAEASLREASTRF